MKLTTAAQVREIDRKAVEEFGIPGVVLMENAGAAVARAAQRLWQEEGAGGPLVIVCGPGNNGGDGLVAARHLHNRGLPVHACLLVSGRQLEGEAAHNYALARSYGMPLTEEPSAATLRRHLQHTGLIVDAILGTGLTGKVHGEAARAIEAIGHSSAPILAVDIPSGVSSETGAILGQAVSAARTVTFGLAKVGMYCYPGRAYCGEIEVVDISLPRVLLTSDDLQTELITPQQAAAGLPPRAADMHKGAAGHLLLIAGSPGMTGAAALAAQAAVRAGAGLAYLAIPESLNPILESQVTEPITLPVAETEAGTLSLQAADVLLTRAADCEAVVLGPGLSRHEQTGELVARLVGEIKQPLVVDADALNLLAGRTEILARRRGATVITPHPGELSRLREVSVGEIQSDRVSLARKAAVDLDCVVLLKGAGTVCAAPTGEALINPTGNHGLASGGTGDVLAGMLGAFLAGGSTVLEAAAAAAYYHGRAADLYAEDFAPRSLAAGDLLDYLPLALREGEEV